MTEVLGIVAYLVAINFAVFAAFGWDKRQARLDNQRISESALLNLAFFGGSFGAKIAQRKFRHKTWKQPFGRQLNAIVAFHILAVCGGFGWLVFNSLAP